MTNNNKKLEWFNNKEVEDAQDYYNKTAKPYFIRSMLVLSGVSTFIALYWLFVFKIIQYIDIAVQLILEKS